MDDDNFSSSAPSYALESDDDSESNWDDLEGAQPHEQRQKVQSKEALIELEGKVQEGTEVIFLVGEAGERLNVSVKDEGVKVLLNGEQVGAIHSGSTTTSTLVFLSVAIPLSALHPLVSTLLKHLNPKTTTILASYNFPSYTTSSSTLSYNPDHPPILYLRSESTPALESSKTYSIIHPFSPPNLLHGLPASLLSLSTLSSIPSTLLLFPTASANEPLNGPWSNNSITTTNATSLFDIGPLSDRDGMMGLVKKEIGVLAKELKWNWLTGGEGAKIGELKGFSWLEKIRKVKRREQMGSMYM